ncbi:glycosyltransferase involved in cell wall biosynthesis [Chryseobacterium sp. SLBN-27]|uniref:glycosyltransferase family 2 protein n=1 Tax=Chryseobacterium sp. SLBN-27 TaxID=3042287 RepID=UPI00286572BA|nr:glycosyltransferase [Chryseobacterium sp. SLBN-27]MDR6157090.1 glycosyltransferase involved in cell wall biosynthesis [Chryseobacterium sp. SLBN-27]
MKKISVLIANYNNGKFFKDCYFSLINQTYPNWEAIIVDDASTDNSLEIIENLIKNDSRFQLFKNTENKGCGFTKKRCVEFANGEICGFLDPDDALFPEALEKSAGVYDTGDFVAAYSKMLMCDDNLAPQNVYAGTKQIYNNPYFFNCPIQVAHFFTFRKEIYLKTPGINPDLKRAVDQDLYLKILELGEVAYIDDVLYKYRLHSAGISQQNGKQSAKDSFAYLIFEAMKRRGIKEINHHKVPDNYTNPEEIYKLLDYQTGFLYRLETKFKLFFHHTGIIIFSIFIDYSNSQYLNLCF